MSKLPQHIEELFDKKFKKKFEYYELEFGDYGPPKDDSFVTEVKSFIATILEEERDRIIGALLKMQKIVESDYDGYPQIKSLENVGFNLAIKKIINLIKEDK